MSHKLLEQIEKDLNELEDLRGYVKGCKAMMPGEGLLAVKIERLTKELGEAQQAAREVAVILEKPDVAGTIRFLASQLDLSEAENIRLRLEVSKWHPTTEADLKAYEQGLDR